MINTKLTNPLTQNKIILTLNLQTRSHCEFKFKYKMVNATELPKKKILMVNQIPSSITLTQTFLERKPVTRSAATINLNRALPRKDQSHQDDDTTICRG